MKFGGSTGARCERAAMRLLLSFCRKLRAPLLSESICNVLSKNIIANNICFKSSISIQIMGPRTAKAKKTVDVKVTEKELPKKGRGKTKVAEEPELETAEPEVIDEIAANIEKKTKRGKKAANTNGQGDTNGVVVEKAPAKKGKKKNVEEPAQEDKPNSISDDAEQGESPVPSEESEQNNEQTETNNHVDEQIETQTKTVKGRKKQTKNEGLLESNSSETKVKETGKGKKKQPVVEDEPEKEQDEKPKPATKGRGRKANPKVETQVETEDKTETKDEDSKPEPLVTKGKKKTQSKVVADKSPEGEEVEPQEEKDLEEKVEIKKNEPKGRKGKKVIIKEDSTEEPVEEPLSKKRKVNKKKDSKDEEPVEEEEVPQTKPAKGKRGQKKVAEETNDAEDTGAKRQRKPADKVESQEEEVTPEDVPPAKPAKGKRGKKAPVEAPEAEEEPQDTGEPTSKRRRKPTDDKAPAEDGKKKAPLKNKSTTDYEGIDFLNTSKSSLGKEWNFKISSWNVDGVRAWLGKGGLEYIEREKPDILCLQELKCSQEKFPEEIANLPGYHAYWLPADKDGYSGVGVYTTKLAMNVQYGLQDEELDAEGRIITAEYEQFYLICAYVPNAGRKLVTLPKRLRWDERFTNHVKELDKKKPVIICGDMNVAHNEIDLANPKANRRNAGFTEEERAGMSRLLGAGLVDTYRRLHPARAGAYTFWTYMMNSRAKNVGWRLDYFIVSERILPLVCDSVIRDGVYGSDHCPITLFLHLTTADKPKE